MIPIVMTLVVTVIYSLHAVLIRFIVSKGDGRLTAG